MPRVPFFASREDAARRLGEALTAYRATNPLVLAIPRGAVAMGRIIADTLGGDLDVVLVRKLPSPWNAEFAVGAIEESGWTWIAEHADAAGADDAYLETEKAHQLALLHRRRAEYTPGRPPAPILDRVVIVVDDGLATGATMIAALHAIREKRPSRLVCALPVAAPTSLPRVRALADEVVCLHAPPDFSAVGQFYGAFPQVDDAEVVRLLSSARSSPPPPP